MNKEEYNANQLYSFLPSNSEGINVLIQLALDLQWLWNHAADEIWSRLDPQLWEITHNTWIVLQTISLDKLESTLADPVFLEKVLERTNSFMKETGVSFETALALTRAGNLFTTHTAVAAGFDHFSPALMEELFFDYAKELGVELKDILALGRSNPDNSSESFNMVYLAIRGSGAVNGVSKLHGEVSRHLFETLFPRWPTDEIPVGHVTNGVHMPSWDAEAADKIWTEACGKERWKGTLENPEDKMDNSSNNGIELYNANVITTSPADDYTIRIIPNYESISVPLENNLILCQQ
ncbi:MAG: DUF3417 domain-containing protein [Chitinophagaceae bacterium]